MNRQHNYSGRCIGCKPYLETISAFVPESAGHAIRILFSSHLMNQEAQVAACAE
jgi:hypothetical protein